MLRHGYLVLFHHLPPVSRKPREFPSCPLKSVRALPHKEEVSEMLQKGALESVVQPCLGFYCCLFLVKAMGLEAGHQFVYPQRLCDADQVPGGDSGVSLGVYLEQGPLLPNPHSSGLSLLPLVRFRGSGLPVSSPVLQPVHSSRSGGHQQGVCLLWYLNDWLVVAELLPLLLRHRYLVLRLCRDLGIVINWEKLDFQPSTRVQYLGMVIDTSLERVFPSEAQLYRFREVVSVFLALPSPVERMRQQLLGHLVLLERFLPRGHSHMHPLQWRLKDRRAAGVLLQVPPPSLLLSLSGWGAHLLDLTAAQVWYREESCLHINVLKMQWVVLALAAFLPQLSDQSILFMSDNTIVVAYLRNQGGTVSWATGHMTGKIVWWTELHSVTLAAQYIPGKKNVLVDQLSCPDQVILTEWSLLPRVFKEVYGVFGHPHLNLFAIWVITKLPFYISPVLDAMAWRHDAFQHPWDYLSAYAFPPFALLRQVLSRVLLSMLLSLILVVLFGPQKVFH